MQLDQYYSCIDDCILFSREQASDFAKGVAGDFNPIHDVDAKRFCVPGDLLFSLALQEYGLSRHMRVTFSGMVGDDVSLHFPQTDSETLAITDTGGKTYLSLERSGECSRDPELISAITQRYVQFSGRTFPHILVPLMADKQVMLNPERPLVVYESMSIELADLDFTSPELVADRAELNVQGKRGDARLRFAVMADGRKVGSGEKTMLLSGLRSYDQGKVDSLVSGYMANKEKYRESHT